MIFPLNGKITPSIFVFFLTVNLNFRKHVEEKAKIANKGIGMLRFLSRFVGRKVLDQIYKMFVRPHLDYGDVIYHDQVKDSMAILEAIQYKAGLIVSGSWKGTNRAKLYKELGWESLSDRRHIRRLMLYYKINANLTPRYLKDCMAQCPPATTARFKNSFFLIARNTGTFSRLILDLSPLMVSLNQLFSNLFVQPSSRFLVLLMLVALSFLLSSVLI